MNSAPVNIQRDGIYLDTELGVISLSSTHALTGNPQINALVQTQIDIAHAEINRTAAVSVTAGQWVGIGCYMRTPTLDRQPFRVKGSFFVEDFDASNVLGAIVVGSAPATPIGFNDQLTNARVIPFQGDFDDLIIVEKITTLSDRALGIGMMIIAPVAFTSKTFGGHLSVQDLGVKPPTMQNAVS